MSRTSKYSKTSKASRKSVRRHRPRFEGESTYDRDFKKVKVDYGDLRAKDTFAGPEHPNTIKPKFQDSTVYKDDYSPPRKEKKEKMHAVDSSNKIKKRKPKKTKKPALETSTIYK